MRTKAIKCNGMLYASGSIGLDPKVSGLSIRTVRQYILAERLRKQTMKLVGEGVEDQAEQVMQNLEGVLSAAGCSWRDVVKTTILCVMLGFVCGRNHLMMRTMVSRRLTSIGDFTAVNQIYGKRFPADPPARATFAVAALPLGAKVSP